MSDEQNDQENDQPDANRQQEQAQIPTEPSQKNEIKKRKKSKPEFEGTAAHKALKQKILEIINGGK